MDHEMNALLDLVDQRERSAQMVIDARSSDERHRLTAARYLQSLEAFRTILREHADEAAVEEVPAVEAVAKALGVELETGTG